MAPAPGPLTLHCEPAALRAVRQAPLQLHAVLRNAGDRPCTVDLGADGLQALRLHVQRPDGSTAEGLRIACSGFAADGEVDLAPQATHRIAVLLQRWHPFKRVGAYRVRLSLQLGDAVLPAAPVVVSVMRRNAAELSRCAQALLERALQPGMAPATVEAAQALAWMGAPEAVPALLQLLERAPRLRGLALQGLAHVGDAAARERLAQLAASADPELALQAARALRSQARPG